MPRVPVALKGAADGSMWCTVRRAQAVACFDPTAADPVASLRTFTSPSIADPSALFAHADGRIWWVKSGTARIGTLDPADPTATIGRFGPWPDCGTPRAWAVAADGRLWLTTQDRPGLLTFDPTAVDGSDALGWSTDDRLRSPDGVLIGADGCIWAVDTAADAIMRFDPAVAGREAWTPYGGRPDVHGPFDIKAGGNPADGWLWFTNKDGNSIGRIRTA